MSAERAGNRRPVVFPVYVMERKPIVRGRISRQVDGETLWQLRLV